MPHNLLNDITWEKFVTGNMPGTIGMVMPDAAARSLNFKYTSGSKKNWVIARLALVGLAEVRVACGHEHGARERLLLEQPDGHERWACGADHDHVLMIMYHVVQRKCVRGGWVSAGVVWCGRVWSGVVWCGLVCASQ